MMKNKLFVIALIFMFTNLYSQTIPIQEKVHSRYKIGLSGGVNISGDQGTRFSPRLTFSYQYKEHWHFSLSTGYSYFTNPSRTIQSQYTNLQGDRISNVSTTSKSEYKFIPVELGVKYILFKEGITPYLSFNMGYDFFFDSGVSETTREERNLSNNEIVSSSITSYGGTSFSKFRMGLGLGVFIPVTNSINLDFNYSFQLNTTTGDYHSVNVGFGYSF